MTQIAVELSRRTTPEIVKEQVREKATEQSAVLKSRAREMAMQRGDRVVQGAQERSGLLSTLGALTGAIIGGLLVKKAIDKGGDRYDRSFHAGEGYGYYGPTERPLVQRRTSYASTGGYNTGYSEGYAAGPDYAAGSSGDVSGAYVGTDFEGSDFEGSESGGKFDELKGKASEKLDSAKHVASEKFGSAKHVASEKFGSAKHLAGERFGQARERASGISHRVNGQHAKENIEQHPLAYGIAAFGLGMLASSLLPVSEKERQLIDPAKERAMARAKEQMHEVQGKVERRIKGAAQALGVGESSQRAEESEEDVNVREEERLGISDEEMTPSLH